MSDRVLRTMYTGMVRGRAEVEGLRGAVARAGRADVACFAAAMAGLRGSDVVFGCRADGVLEAVRVGASMPRVADGLGRLYAVAGAAMTFAKGSERVAMAYFERHEVEAGWFSALGTVADLPLVLVVLPRWKGENRLGLSRTARDAGVPGIAVDAADAVAVYRVAQESLVRARMGGGTALIEGVWFELPGQPAGKPADAVAVLGDFLLRRGVVSEGWLRRVGANAVRADGMQGRSAE